MLAFVTAVGGGMLIGAVGVITLRQPVHAALSLVGTLLTLAMTLRHAAGDTSWRRSR